MKTRICLLALGLIFLFSCQRIILRLAGVRVPQEETIVSLKKFMIEQKCDTFDLYVPKDTSAFIKLNRISSSQSGYLFFNENKRMLLYKDTGQACSAPVILFAKNICNSNKQLYYKDLRLNMITDLIVPISEASQHEVGYDRYAVIFWYKYLGKRKFESDVKSIVDDLRRSACRVKIFLIDLDLQPGWKNQIPIRIQG